MDKSEDLRRKSKLLNRWNRVKNRGCYNWPQKHTHIQTVNSHWQLRLSHCPLTQHSSWPLWLLPNNNMKLTYNSYQEFTCRVRKQWCNPSHIMYRNAKQIWLWLTKWFSLIRYCMIHECTIIKMPNRDYTQCLP